MNIAFLNKYWTFVCKLGKALRCTNTCLTSELASKNVMFSRTYVRKELQNMKGWMIPEVELTQVQYHQEKHTTTQHFISPIQVNSQKPESRKEETARVHCLESIPSAKEGKKDNPCPWKELNRAGVLRRKLSCTLLQVHVQRNGGQEDH